MADTLARYREAFPEFRDMKDAELVDNLWNKYGGEKSGIEKEDFALQLQGRGPRVGPFRAGIEGLKGAAETAVARGAQALGAEETAKEYLGRAEERQADIAARYQPETRSFEDVDSAYKFGRYLYERFGESAPQMLLQVGGGIGGLALRGAAGAVGLAAARGLSPTAAASLGATAAGTGAYTGYNIQRQMEEGTPFEETSLGAAGAAALGQSALDTLSLATILRGFPGLSAAQAGSRVAAAVRRGVEGGATEALTESGQQALEILQANPEKLMSFSPEVQNELKEAAIAGGLLGGALGGAGGAISYRKPRTETPVKPGMEAEAPAAEGEGAAATGEGEGEAVVEGATPPPGGEAVVEGATPPPPVMAPAPRAAPEPVPSTTVQGPAPVQPAPLPGEVVEPFKPENVPPLPKKLAAGAPKYDKFRLQFPSGIERALFQISKANPTKQDMEYRNWLKDQGLTDQEITDYGKQLRVQLKDTYKQMRGRPANAIMPVKSFVPAVPETPAPAFPVRQQPAPKPSLTLSQFVASQGGIQDTDGELSARNLSNKMTGRYGRLVRKKGMKPEQALRAAVDAGYYTVLERDEAGGYQPPKEMLDQFYNDLGTDLRDVETQRLESEGLFQEREAPEVENRRQIEAAVSSAAKEFDIADPQAETLASDYIERGEVSDPADALERAITSLGAEERTAQPKNVVADPPFFEDVPVYKMADKGFYDSGLVQVPAIKRSFTPVETTTVGSMLDRIKVDFEGVPGEVYRFISDRLKSIVGDLKIQIVDAKQIEESGVGADGWYSSNLDHIVISSGVLNKPRRLAHVVLHESIHAATAIGIESGGKIKADLQRIMDVTLAQVGDRKASDFGFSGNGLVKDLYAFRENNPLEFLAEALSNRNLINLLQSTPVDWDLITELGWEPEYGFAVNKKEWSLWGTFVDAIRRLLRVTDKEGWEAVSALEAVLLPYQGAELTTKAIREGRFSGVSGQPIFTRMASEAPADITAATQKLAKVYTKPESMGFKGFLKAVKEAYDSGSYKNLGDKIAYALTDRFIYVKRMQERYVDFLKKQGLKLEAAYDDRHALAANLSPYAAILGRENVLGMLETLIKFGGVPVIKKFSKSKDPLEQSLDGMLLVDNTNNKVGLTFLADLIRAEKLDAFKYYSMAKRVLGRYADKQAPITKAEAQAIIDHYGKDPVVTKAYQDYQNFNKALMQMAVDAGVISQDVADEFTKHNDYYPFYREMDETGRYTGPLFTSGVLTRTKIQQAMGGTEQLQADPVEVIMKNAQFWMHSASKNLASNKIFTMMEGLGEAQKIKKGAKLPPDQSEGVTRVNGVEQYYALKDPVMAAALETTGAYQLPNWTRIPNKFTQFYRELVTRSPDFILKNVIRDPVQAFVTSGVSFNPFNAIQRFVKGVTDPQSMTEMQAIQNWGIKGGYRSIPGVEDATQLLNENFKPTSNGVYVVPNGRVLSGIISKVWNKLGDISEASDAATRTEVYRQVLEKTGNEAEAAFRAQEVINFRKQGASSIVRYMSIMIPFVNGRLQGMDVTARAFGPKAFANTMIKGGYLFGVSMALQAMFGDDDEYKQLPDYVRHGSLPIPLKLLGFDGGFLAIPKSFEIGFVFQTFPEILVQAAMGNVENRDIPKAAWEQLKSTFGVSPFPQIAAPLFELAFNRSSLTGLPIVTEAQKNLPAELQYTSATSDVVKNLAGAAGLSPVQVEALIKGYGGQIVTSVLGLVDGMYRSATGTGVEKDWTQYPTISTFLKTAQNTNPKGVADIYRLSAEIQGVTTAINTYVAQGRADLAQELMKKNEGLLTMKQSVTGLRTQLNTLSRNERMIVNNPNIPQDQKEIQVEQIREARRQIGKVMTENLIDKTGK